MKASDFSNSPSRSEYDAVVIGSGPNGLAAAIYLAQKGASVLVIEAYETPGGGMRSREVTLPGYTHDICAAVHPMAQASPFFKTLPLAEQGLEWLHPDYPVAQPLDDGRAAVGMRDLEATAEALGEDGAAYRRLVSPLVRDSEKIYDTLLGPLKLPKHPMAMAGFGMRAIRSARGLAEGSFKTEEARALFAGHAAHSVQPLERPLTAAVGLMLAVTCHAQGWPVAKGGSGEIARALVKILQSHGGEVICGKRVETIEELPKAKAYLFDVSPPNMARMCSLRLPPGYQKTLKNYRFGPGVFKVDWALSDPIPWANAECRKAGTVHVGGTFDDVSRSEASCWKGHHVQDPFLLVSQPTIWDGTRAPRGKHTAWAYCHVPNGSTMDMLPRIQAQIERYAPGFGDCIEETHTLSCGEMESYNPNYVGGDVIGGVQDWRQLFTRPAVRIDPYSTPVKNIFICSASTPPGGGVHGMAGYHAARSAEKVLG